MRKTTLKKEELIWSINYEIDDACNSAKRYHRRYLEAIKTNDTSQQDYLYDVREQRLFFARKMKNLLLSPSQRIRIYPKLLGVRHRRLLRG